MHILLHFYGNFSLQAFGFEGQNSDVSGDVTPRSRGIVYFCGWQKQDMAWCFLLNLLPNSSGIIFFRFPESEPKRGVSKMMTSKTKTLRSQKTLKQRPPNFLSLFFTFSKGNFAPSLSGQCFIRHLELSNQAPTLGRRKRECALCHVFACHISFPTLDFNKLRYWMHVSGNYQQNMT